MEEMAFQGSEDEQQNLGMMKQKDISARVRKQRSNDIRNLQCLGHCDLILWPNQKQQEMTGLDYGGIWMKSMDLIL